MNKHLPQVIRTYQNHILDSTRWNRYKPRPTDIIIATSYKSGTTWTQEIVRQLIFQGQETPAQQAVGLWDVSPWLECRFVPFDECMAKLEAQEHRRFIKSHLALDGLPFYPQVKYVVVCRDARDVFMSYWNHCANFTPDFVAFVNSLPGRVGSEMPDVPQDIHEFWQTWITRGWFPWESEGYPSWGNLHHTKTWWEYRHLPNILFVHYADLLADLPGEIQRIAGFLEIPISTEVLQTVCNAVTLDRMRRADKEGNNGKERIWRDGADTFFFKGTNGRWKYVLSAEELLQYEEKVASVLAPACRNWLEQGRNALLQ